MRLIGVLGWVVVVAAEDEEKALASGQAAIDAFPELYRVENQNNMRAKLGLTNRQDEDEVLVQDFLELLQEHSVDYTLAFRRLSEVANPGLAQNKSVSSFFEFSGAFTPWIDRWSQRLRGESENSDTIGNMMKVNPVYIPRNHLVEEAIEAASRYEDFEPFNDLVVILAKPYEFDMEAQAFALPPKRDQVVQQTFCGT